MEITKLVQINSLEIAKITGKNHYDVLRDIRNMLCELELTELKFAGSYKDGSGKVNPMFILPKREALILASGYSIKLRAKIIDKLEELTDKKADIAWQEGRKLLKDEYAPMSEAVKEIREAQGKETKHYHYSNEANLICMVLKGMTVAKYKKLFNQGQFRDSLSTEDIAMLTRLQNINTGLIHADWDYDKRKAYLTKYYDGKKNLRLVQPHQQKLKEGA